MVALVRFAGRGLVLDGDEAIFALQVRDAATGGFPTTGLYSWNGWSHPGPIGFYLFAPFHWLSGGATWGTLVGAGVWSAVTVVLVAWLAARRGSTALVMAALAIQLATWIAAGGSGVIDPWTPNLAVALVVPFLLAAWGLAVGDSAATVTALIVGTIAVQLHIGYSVLVGVVGVTAIFAAWSNGRCADQRDTSVHSDERTPTDVDPAESRTSGHPQPVPPGERIPAGVDLAGSRTSGHRQAVPPDGRTLRMPQRAGLAVRALIVGSGVAVVLWLPVVIDLLIGRTGNLRALVRYFRSGTPKPAGLAEGARIVAGELSPWPTWITGPRPHGLFLEAGQSSALWLIGLAALVVVGLTLRRSSGLMIAAAALTAATLACSQLRGFRYHYLVYWRVPIVLFILAMLARAVLGVGKGPSAGAGSGQRQRQRRRRGRTTRWVVGAIFVVALVGSTWGAARAAQVTRHGDVVRDIVGQARPQAPTAGRLLLRLGDAGVVGILPGLLHDLELRGVDVGVDRDIEWVFGDRGMDPATATDVWYVTDNGWSYSLLTAQPGARVIASRSPYDEASEARVVKLQRALATQLRAAGRVDAVRSLDSALLTFALADIPGLDPEAVADLGDLNARLDGLGHRLGVVAFPTDSQPDLWWPLNSI